MKTLLRVLLLVGAAVLVPACDDGGDTIINNVTSGGPPPASGSILFFAQNNNALVNVSATNPSQILGAVPLIPTTAGGPGTLLGMDYRPLDGLLYATASFDRLWLINPSTGVGLIIGNANFTPSTPGNVQGFDFNPTVDRVRRTTDSDSNARIDPSTGAILGGAFDTSLAYAAGDPNVGADPHLSGVAYTNNFAGAVTTTLYGIDTNLGILVVSPLPNGGQLTTVGPLGVTPVPFSDVGFDISPSGTAYAAITDNADNLTKLYTIDLNTGAATLVGILGTGQAVRGFAVVP